MCQSCRGPENCGPVAPLNGGLVYSFFAVTESARACGYYSSVRVHKKVTIQFCFLLHSFLLYSTTHLLPPLDCAVPANDIRSSQLEPTHSPCFPRQARRTRHAYTADPEPARDSCFPQPAARMRRAPQGGAYRLSCFCQTPGSFFRQSGCVAGRSQRERSAVRAFRTLSSIM